MVNNCFGNVYYDSDDEALTGDDLIQACAKNQVASTHFAKNVYATTRPVLDHEWTPLLFPELYDQFNSESSCGSGSKFLFMDTCSQIHSPMTTYHPEGKTTVSYVEEQYSLKWEYIRNSDKPVYDAFLDNTVAYWVDDLAKYHSLWTEVGADMVYLRWYVKNPNANADVASKTYYSLLTHNGDATTGSTLTQYEIISDTFSSLTDDIINTKLIDSEQRIFFDSNTDYRSFSVGCEIVPIGARRAVTSLDDNIEWYKTIFASSIVEDTQVIVDEYEDSNGNTVKYAHIKLYPSTESTTISFFERDSVSGTYGDFSVLDFEKAMTDTHNENMVSPFCGIDRWFDMHYAIMFGDTTTSEKVFAAMMESGEKYTVYREWKVPSDNSMPVFVYMTEPNGHSVQLIFNLDDNLKFKTYPQQWDADWCPMNCTNEMESYDYGDSVAFVRFSSDENTFVNLSGKNEKDKQEIASLIISIVGIFSIVLIAAIIGLYVRRDKFNYQQLPQ